MKCLYLNAFSGSRALNGKSPVCEDRQMLSAMLQDGLAQEPCKEPIGATASLYDICTKACQACRSGHTDMVQQES